MGQMLNCPSVLGSEKAFANLGLNGRVKMLSCVQDSIEIKWPFPSVENTEAYSQCLQIEN